MKVVILTEGSHATGYGHLTRCLSIYQAFKEKGTIPVYIAHCDDRGREILLGVHLLCFNWLVEVEKLYEIVDNADLLIIDSYLATESVYIDLSSMVAKAAYFDDYQRIKYPKGVIINGTIGAENLDYGTNRHNELLLGVEYAPIRKEFWDIPPRNNRHNVQNVLITFGGYDKKGITFGVLEMMLQRIKEMNYTIVMGSELDRNWVDKYEKMTSIELLKALTAANMLEVMLKCDVAISAAGQTLYELARVGIPTIAVGVAQNQRNNVDGWIKNRFIHDAIWYDDPDCNKKIFASFTHALRKEYRDMVLQTIPALVDGQGARRIVSRI